MMSDIAGGAASVATRVGGLFFPQQSPIALYYDEECHTVNRVIDVPPGEDPNPARSEARPRTAKLSSKRHILMTTTDESEITPGRVRRRECYIICPHTLSDNGIADAPASRDDTAVRVEGSRAEDRVDARLKGCDASLQRG